MRSQHPLKQILLSAPHVWNRPDVRPGVRQNFRKLIDCRTPALGAEVYASAIEQKIVPHSCKSPCCPSCGHKATELWQTDQFNLLPDIPYVGVVFTMPNVLWPLFQRNRHLLRDLSVLGAEVIRQWVKTKDDACPIVMVVPHTFGRHLDFKPHLHILISAGGLSNSEARWIRHLSFVKGALMPMWRYAVITYLREAIKARVLSSDQSAYVLTRALATQYERRWIINIDHFSSKKHFLRYAGRYVRRPPIAQHRFAEITTAEVKFWTKDLKLKQKVKTVYLIEDFIRALAEHVPDRYQHSMRYFGLWAPRSRNRTSAAMFLLLGQNRPSRSPRLGWADLLMKHFGVNPLIDSAGQRMNWIGRQKAVVS